MRYLTLPTLLLIAITLAPAEAAKSKKDPRQSQARMSDQDVRAKCINDYQRSTGSTGPQTAQQVIGNSNLYADCVRRYGVRP